MAMILLLIVTEMMTMVVEAIGKYFTIFKI